MSEESDIDNMKIESLRMRPRTLAVAQLRRADLLQKLGSVVHVLGVHRQRRLKALDGVRPLLLLHRRLAVARVLVQEPHALERLLDLLLVLRDRYILRRQKWR